MSAEGPTIFVVDDDPSVLRSLERMFHTEGYAVRSFAQPRLMLACEPWPGPGCVVMDLRMPELNGLELQERLRQAGWRHPVVFISGAGDVPGAVRAMKAGAVDFLPKPVSAEVLLAAVLQALARDQASRAANAEREQLRLRFSTLSPREWDVCRGVARGLLNKQIAAELGTAEQTVRFQRGRVMAKLAVSSVPELVRLLDRLESRSGVNPQTE
ncbi:response regulator transcription factor [Corallococcus carmarthensis]|uniref:response regulator transcription factor n=1 Tax=Corallococcus carmarthensis TaxID=2316728 RepID=UPI001FC9601F|nr:response regulator [Corallococcus carmarthensis]